jgi:bacterioferritin
MADAPPNFRADNGDAEHAFVIDVAQIRRRARQHIQDGAMTDDAATDSRTVLRLLDEALATELVCVLRYKRHYYMGGGPLAEAAKGELLQYANEEQGHADQLAQRIVQLGGSPNFNPAGLVDRSHLEYGERETLSDMLAEDLIAERIAIVSYREIIQYLGNKDATTRRLFESILAIEEQHAEDLRIMREALLDRQRPTGGAMQTPTSRGSVELQ